MEFKVGGKLGYLMEKTGKYKWVKIIGVIGNELCMKEVIRCGRGHISLNLYTEIDYIVKNHMETPSCNFSDGRVLMKYKGCK